MHTFRKASENDKVREQRQSMDWIEHLCGDNTEKWEFLRFLKHFWFVSEEEFFDNSVCNVVIGVANGKKDGFIFETLSTRLDTFQVIPMEDGLQLMNMDRTSFLTLDFDNLVVLESHVNTTHQLTSGYFRVQIGGNLVCQLNIIHFF